MITREPIITRHAIVLRVPFVSKLTYKHRSVCVDTNDYVTIDTRNSDYTTDELGTQFRSLQQSKRKIHLIIDRQLPKETLWAASFSEENTLQLNVNLTSPSSNTWVGTTLSIAHRCGMYSIVYITPVLPSIVKSYQLLRMIDQLKSITTFKVVIDFGGLSTPLLDQTESINYNGVILGRSSFKKDPHGYWECSEDYKNEFMSLIELYTTQRKIPVIECKTILDMEACLENY